MGLSVEASYPGRGVVIAFDDHAVSFVLTREATTPDEYVSPIAAWLSDGKIIGRVYEVICPHCDKKGFATEHEAKHFMGLCDFCQKELRMEDLRAAAVSGDGWQHVAAERSHAHLEQISVGADVR